MARIAISSCSVLAELMHLDQVGAPELVVLSTLGLLLSSIVWCAEINRFSDRLIGNVEAKPTRE